MGDRRNGFNSALLKPKKSASRRRRPTAGQHLTHGVECAGIVEGVDPFHPPDRALTIHRLQEHTLGTGNNPVRRVAAVHPSSAPALPDQIEKLAIPPAFARRTGHFLAARIVSHSQTPRPAIFNQQSLAGPRIGPDLSIRITGLARPHAVNQKPLSTTHSPLPNSADRHGFNPKHVTREL